jgi:uncharacterized protein YggE
MKTRIGLVLVVMALLLVGGLLSGCSEGVVLNDGDGTNSFIWSQQNSGIWVNGEGSVTVVPDIAVLSLGVETQAATVAQAQAQAVEAMDVVMTELENWGINESDMKTQHYSIYPVKRYNNGQEILIGYRVTNTVTVKVRQVDDTGAIIDTVVRVGGDTIRINNIYFTVDDPSDFYQQAREAAMEDATTKAQQLAELSGVKLGIVTYISEGGGYYPGPYYDIRSTDAEAGATTPISPGEMDITLYVQVVYSIKK